MIIATSQLRVVWSGRVQGVGFRATTQAIAHELKIRGWVRNLRDGRVEALAQADQSTLIEWLRRVDVAMPGASSRELDWQEVTDSSNTFSISPTL